MCWEARDIYFKCLDKHSIVDSIRNKEEAEKACPQEQKELEGNCASSWVSTSHHALDWGAEEGCEEKIGR